MIYNFLIELDNEIIEVEIYDDKYVNITANDVLDFLERIMASLEDLDEINYAKHSNLISFKSRNELDIIDLEIVNDIGKFLRIYLEDGLIIQSEWI